MSIKDLSTIQPLDRKEPDSVPARKTLADNAKELYARCLSLQRSPQTVARIEQALKKFIDYMENYPHVNTAGEITIEHIHAFQGYLSQKITDKGLPYKPITINTIIKGVRALLELLNDYGYITRPLAKHLKYIREPKFLPTSVLTHAQVHQFMRKIDTTTPCGICDRTVIELLYSSGIRISEFERLTLADLDLERGVARVFGKGKKERFVPIGKTAMKWLLSYIRGVRPYMLKGRKTDHVFINMLGKPLKAHTMCDRIRAYGKQLNLDIQITPHTFRRSCTSEMIKSNANLYHVKQLLGHDSFDTLDHYAKLDVTDLQKTHERCHPREKDEI